ncbi:phosphotransferase enzyme family protein [Azospirillum halopraeferens]|uniref:phosphotransferase enzyme family protein n=1 Tax=Azospirillum halopraeferens TaxID=34010 RepID=UPI0004172011|nr:phosphotransferase [Azospirillum halopraeferens]
MAGEYAPEVLTDLEAAVRAALPVWSLSPRSDVRLLNVSENATYLLSDPDDGRNLVLRVHRRGYHTPDEIRSELAWIRALQAERVIDTPALVPGRDGELLQRIESPAGWPARHAVAFEYVPGREPEPNADLVPWFRTLGALTARMHIHARSWPLPPGFRRKTWDCEAMFGERPLWGPWRAGLGLDAEGTALMERAIALIARRLARFGTESDRFGLVHADLRLANLLVDGATMRVIDFDDCGVSWYLYDFASAVSFFEHEPIVDDLMVAWVDGYRSVAPLSDEEARELPVFVAMRRFLLVAWLASHSEVPLAQEMGVDYTRGALAMAERLLTTHS